MGTSRKPVQRWEVLGVVGISIKLENNGITVQLTVDGAARLVQGMQRWNAGKGDISLLEPFLEELTNKGSLARRRMVSTTGRLTGPAFVCLVPLGTFVRCPPVLDAGPQSTKT